MSRLDEIRGRNADTITFTFPTCRFNERELRVLLDLQREVAQVCRDRAFLLDLVERAMPILYYLLRDSDDEHAPLGEIDQWLKDAGYREDEG